VAKSGRRGSIRCCLSAIPSYSLCHPSRRFRQCAWEVEEALRLSKRILPVIASPLGGAKPPERLQRLNFIYFYPEKSVPGSGFGDGLVKLNVALKSDLDWLREHTRLLERATEWDKGNRPPNRMLSGTDIGAAKAWAARRPREAPEPTALQLEYIKASEAYEAAQQNERQRQLEERERLVKQSEADRAAREAAQVEATSAAKREALQARRVARRTMIGLAASVILTLVAAAAGALAWQQQRVARGALARVLAERSWTALSTDNRDLAVRYGLAGWHIAPQNAAYYRAPLAQALLTSFKPANSGHLHNARVRTLATSSDGKFVVSIADDGDAALLDAASGQLVARLGTASITRAAAVDPSGQKLMTVSDDAAISIWELATGKLLMKLMGHAAPITAAVFSPDATRLATASFDKTARLWEMDTGRQLVNLIGHTDVLSAVAFSPDGALLVTGSFDHTAIVWEASTGRLIGLLQGHQGAVTSVAFSPDGRSVLTGSVDQSVIAWKLRDTPRRSIP
jgi:hypothetical protein